MTHIEDKVLYGGVKGTREAILALRSLRDMLSGVDKGGGKRFIGARVGIYPIDFIKNRSGVIQV